MSEYDALFRGGAIGISLLLCLAFWRSGQNRRVAWIGSLYVASTVGYLLWVGPIGLPSSLLVRAILGALALAPPFFLWVLARLVFDDAFSLRPRHWLWLLVIEVAGFANAMLQGKAEPWLLYSLGYGYRLLSLGLIVHALWCIWQGRRSDLVEARVRIRALVLSVAGIAAALVLFGTIF